MAPLGFVLACACVAAHPHRRPVPVLARSSVAAHPYRRPVRARAHRTVRSGAVATAGTQRVALAVCTDSLCESLGSAEVVRELRASGLGIAVSSCGCLGRCGTRVQVCIEDLETDGCELCDGIAETRRSLVAYGYAMRPGEEG